MKVYSTSVTLSTYERTEISDITKLVRDAVQEFAVTTGIALINTLHTTCAVFINEFQSALIDDLKGLMEGLVPERGGYRHDHGRRQPRPRPPDHGHAGPRPARARRAPAPPPAMPRLRAHAPQPRPLARRKPLPQPGVAAPSLPVELLERDAPEPRPRQARIGE